VAREPWLDTHPFLRPLAAFCARVEAAASQAGAAVAPMPAWDGYRSEYLAGVPLLQSADAAVDLEPAGRMTVALVERLAADSAAGPFAADARLTREELRREAAAASRVASWLIGDSDFAPSRPGLLRYLGWVATTRYLRPMLSAYAGWRDEERWLRNYCPTCASPPSMAQLVGTDPGRMRFLVCGCCGTRWRFNRTGCPFCETNARKIAVIAVEGEGGLRLDYCESCKGYLKTYAGQGNEAVLLADWTSLHLDFAARDRGLRRLAGSLFDLDSLGAQPFHPAEPKPA
jgi:FdhE protein